MRVVFDTNVLIYSIVNDGEHESARELVLAAANERLEGLITANSVTDIYYILRKRIGDARAREALWNLMTVFGVVEVDGEVCATALGSPMKDFEDAVLAQCAKKANADCIVTEDQALLFDGSSPVTLMSIETLLSAI